MAKTKKKSSSKGATGGADKRQKKKTTASRGGAPKGNRNAMKHGVYLNKLRRDKEDEVARKERQLKRQWRALVRSAGVQDLPAARLLADKGAMLSMIEWRIKSYLDKRGWHDNKGHLKDAVTKLLSTVNDQMKALERILQAVGAMGKGPAGESSFIDLVMSADEKHRKDTLGFGG